MSHIPAEFLDPTTKKIMSDPVLTNCGHIFDRNDLHHYFLRKANIEYDSDFSQLISGPCPCCKDIIYASDELSELKTMINTYLKEHPEQSINTSNHPALSEALVRIIDENNADRLIGFLTEHPTVLYHDHPTLAFSFFEYFFTDTVPLSLLKALLNHTTIGLQYSKEWLTTLCELGSVEKFYFVIDFLPVQDILTTRDALRGYPIHTAIYYGQTALVKTLLPLYQQHCKDILFEETQEGYNLLTLACFWGSQTMVTLICDATEFELYHSLQSVDSAGLRPLHTALDGLNRTEIALYFLSVLNHKNALIILAQENSDRENCLDIAATNSFDAAFLRCLELVGDHINDLAFHKDRKGQSLLESAALAQSQTIFRALFDALSQNMKLKAVNLHGVNMIHAMLTRGYTEKLKYCLGHFSLQTQRQLLLKCANKTYTCLHFAYHSNNPSTIRLVHQILGEKILLNTFNAFHFGLTHCTFECLKIILVDFQNFYTSEKLSFSPFQSLLDNPKLKDKQIDAFTFLFKLYVDKLGIEKATQLCHSMHQQDIARLGTSISGYQSDNANLLQQRRRGLNFEQLLDRMVEGNEFIFGGNELIFIANPANNHEDDGQSLRGRGL